MKSTARTLKSYGSINYHGYDERNRDPASEGRSQGFLLRMEAALEAHLRFCSNMRLF